MAGGLLWLILGPDQHGKANQGSDCRRRHGPRLWPHFGLHLHRRFLRGEPPLLQVPRQRLWRLWRLWRRRRVITLRRHWRGRVWPWNSRYQRREIRRPRQRWGFGAGLWWVISSCIALGAGGFVAAWLAGVEIRFDGVLHGLVTWGVATLLTLWLLTSAIGGIVGGGFSALGSVASAAGSGVSDVAHR